jgi:hypothetical protein
MYGVSVLAQLLLRYDADQQQISTPAQFKQKFRSKVIALILYHATLHSTTMHKTIE